MVLYSYFLSILTYSRENLCWIYNVQVKEIYNDKMSTTREEEGMKMYN